ncbi:polysaccharide deacetylase family protein [Paenibacillus sp. CF384]|uniref:polysaccharide deacetylase family protein n=1 Tax=Paenibacillus sp. CF384 TaxID=1884382 RepID=UPI00089640F5|nr:polysaccharide deacetylase family protein [Paenibacillus sp. CF384]SDW70651.1 Peptidoglycan/xylan/chitin deacetylase, PgdA/CDA1 family [Paenibacillus sp. CF384]
MRQLRELRHQRRLATLIVVTLMVGLLSTSCGLSKHELAGDAGTHADIGKGGSGSASHADWNHSGGGGGGGDKDDEPVVSAPGETVALLHPKPPVVTIQPPVMLDQPTEQQTDFVTTKGEKLVALTFDDGPDSHYTPAILDILKAKKIHATFFTVGIQVKKYGKVMRRIRDEGSEIGNHSYAHKDLSKLDSDPIMNQIKWTDALINNQIGYVPHLVRAPYGATSPLLKQIVKDNGRELIGWTVDTRDWAGSSVAAMRANVNKNTHPGGIILMHSFGSKHIRNTVELLPLIIKDLQNKGYTFVTVSELLAAKAHSNHAKTKNG